MKRTFLNTEVKILDASKGLCEYVASDATLDHYREIVDPAGWRFTDFQSNAPFCDSHDTYSIDKLVGKVVKANVENDQLIETVQWAKDVPQNGLAQLGWAMTEAGYLKAVSVGFIPSKAVRAGADGWTEHCDRLKLDEETRRKCRTIFLVQEQIELSACILGANPSALLRAWEDGAVSDEIWERSGMAGEATDFLGVASKAYASPDCDDALRWMMERELKLITDRTRSGLKSKHFGKTHDRTPDSAGGPSGDHQSRQRRAEQAAQERESFLGKLRTLAYLD